MRPSTKLSYWQRFQSAQNFELEHKAILNAPPVKNPPELSRPVKVRVLKPFIINGQPTVAESIITISWFDAEDLRVRGKIEITD